MNKRHISYINDNYFRHFLVNSLYKGIIINVLHNTYSMTSCNMMQCKLEYSSFQRIYLHTVAILLVIMKICLYICVNNV